VVSSSFRIESSRLSRKGDELSPIKESSHSGDEQKEGKELRNAGAWIVSPGVWRGTTGRGEGGGVRDTKKSMFYHNV